MPVRTEKTASGKYRTVYRTSGPLGGRPAGTEQPVPAAKRDPDRNYCACGRRLNRNNSSGTCRTCAPHGRVAG